MKNQIKSLFTGLLLVAVTTFSFNAQADCQSKLQVVLDQEMKPVEGLVHSIGIGAFIMGAIAIGPATLAGGAAAVIVTTTTSNVRNLKIKRMLGVINDSYEYQTTGVVGKKLKKMYRKVRRQLPEVSMDQLVSGIIESNENETLCEIQGLSRYARSISVEL